MKDKAQKILFHLLKIFAAGWCAMGGIAVSVMLLRFLRISRRTEFFVDGLVGMLCAALLLYFFSYREEYRERVANHAPQWDLLCAGLPALLHFLLCMLTRASVYVAIPQSLFVEALANLEPEEITLLQVFCVSLVSDAAYAAALWLGARAGRRKRARDREQLLRTEAERQK